MWSMFFFLTQFLQEVRGLSALQTGFAFLPMAATLFATTRVIARLLTRFGPRLLLMLGALLLIAGLTWLTQLSVTGGYAASLLAPMVLIGLSGGLLFPSIATVIVPTVPAKDAGAASGLLQTMQQIGTSLGLAVLVTVFGVAVRHSGHGAPVTSTLGQHALVAGVTRSFEISVIIAIAVFIAAATVPAHRRQTAATGENISSME
jgi:MFS family permease